MDEPTDEPADVDGAINTASVEKLLQKQHFLP